MSRVQTTVSQTRTGGSQRKQALNDGLTKWILESSQYMSPPFDVLLSDVSSPLFQKSWRIGMKRWSSFTARILQSVGAKEEVLADAIKEWDNFRNSNNATIHDIPDSSSHRKKLSTTRYIWTPTGLGIDCHRNWDVLRAGAIPNMGRGFGLDRTYAFLPVFWVDSYYDLTAEILMDAYPLFVALRDEFDFSRLGKEYWKRLMMSVATEKSDNLLRINHPFPKLRVIWPLPPPNATVEEFSPANFSVSDGVFAYCNSTNTFANLTGWKPFCTFIHRLQQATGREAGSIT